MQLKPEHLIGAWTFVAWTVTWSDGRVTHPFQPDPGGMILYTPDGGMSAVMHAGGRARFPTEDVRKLSAEAKAIAFDTYLHYCGTWIIRGGQVIHRVTSALNPNLIGTEQVRDVAREDALLHLSGDEELAGGRGVRRHRLTWRKLGV